MVILKKFWTGQDGSQLNPSIPEAEAGKFLRFWSQPDLQREFKESKGYKEKTQLEKQK